MIMDRTRIKSDNTRPKNITLMPALKSSTARMLKMKEDRGQVTGKAILDIEERLPSNKTSRVNVLVDYLRAFSADFHQLLRFYDDRVSSLRFLNYIGVQRAGAEAVNILLDCGKKYNRRPLNNELHRRRPRITRARKKKFILGKRQILDQGASLRQT